MASVKEAPSLTLPRSAGEGSWDCLPDFAATIKAAADRSFNKFPPLRSGGGLGSGQHAIPCMLAFLAVLALCLSPSERATASAVHASKQTTHVWIKQEAQKQKPIPGGAFESVLPLEDGKAVTIEGFKLDVTPVTNADFSAFIANNSEWRRDRIARVFADEQYLQHWASPTQPASEDRNKPVVHVSWFAASAYCESRGARLATWHEWEYVAAASEAKRDARNDPAWRQQILAWYSRSAREQLPDVGATPANVYGVRDLHGVAWEWIEDLSALLVANDSREQGDPSKMRFCGAGAVSMEQKENYAMLMRIAMLSSMKANYTSATMGFRCATDGGTTR